VGENTGNTGSEFHQQGDFFLRKRELFFKTKVAELLELVARLTSQIRAGDDIYRRKFFAGRRHVIRLKQKLNQ
jgi:uncharacterized protein (DUF2461 family)